MRRANEALELGRIQDRLRFLRQAVLIFQTRSEQDCRVGTADRDRWTPIDIGGLTLMLRPRVGL